MSKNVIAFDLEGPLSTMDHAYEVMGLIPEGHKIFAVISRYDDLLALEGREGYEPGDTLALIVPFLLAFGIKEKDLIQVSKQANLVPGAKELIYDLREREAGWKPYIVSTSYEQHAGNIATQLGIGLKDVACTRLNLDQFYHQINRENLSFLQQVADYILSELYIEDLESGAKDDLIKSYLDDFFWKKLKQTGLGEIFCEIEVTGGRRKVKAVERFARNNGRFLGEVIVIGDSITDFQMLKAVEAAGGLAVVFNGNQYALPHGTVAVASRSLYDLKPLLKAWLKGGRGAVKEYVLKAHQEEEGPYYHWLIGRSSGEMEEIIRIHKVMRSLVRGEAIAKLG